MPITTPKRHNGRKGESRTLALVLGVFAIFLALVAGGLWFMGGSGSTASPGQEEQTLAVGGPFQLTDGNGKAVTDQDFRGKYMLIYFGYTFCPDVCPTTLQDITTALEKLGSKSSEIQPIFITVDPARDTPAVMKQYAAAFSPRLIGLTGTPAQIDAVEKVYHVYASRHPAATGQAYTVDHSSVLYLMGPDGRFIAPLRADQSGAMIAADLERSIPSIQSKEKS